MPLPPESLQVGGGCNCGAIRYKISIPPLEQRPLHPHSASEDPVHLPFSCIDHCNDCRRATGAIPPIAFCTPISMITSFLVIRSKASLPLDPSKRDPDSKSNEERTSWEPAKKHFHSGTIDRDSFLDFYDSSVGRRRWFCNRCGTNVAYLAFPMPEGWQPDMLDLFLGTVDREDLVGGILAPTRQLWWDCGIDWVKEISISGAGALPRHPRYKPDEDILG
ncbi:hypothetical protein HYFRA_00006081 [Hymenoscyphus fraxineus]|uniref:CENP-V/GFA domain-containing protein n=1 Tax=Hymenoscyphus fraxineus TaxID=746836 RepID=A0A9N9KX60_9HELO|nr:hypothetical protein HYFRA_00006081 [Hymenoscyphus fraxineus]